MTNRDKNIYLISSQLYEFMNDEFPLNEERIVALEIKLKELLENEYQEGYDNGYCNGSDDAVMGIR